MAADCSLGGAWGGRGFLCFLIDGSLHGDVEAVYGVLLGRAEHELGFGWLVLAMEAS